MKPHTTDDVLDLVDGTFTSVALGAALELRLFRLLDETPLDVAGVARALDIPERRCLYWLQLLCDAGLIERADSRYVPSTTARSAILDAFSADSWALLAEEARLRFPVLRDLSRHIREPGSAWEALGLTPPMFTAEMAADPDLARRFTRMLYELHQPLAEELARTLDLDGVERLMDLGGGSGVVSMALLRVHPQLSVTVVDVANVCAAGREIAAEQALQDRLHFHPADFLQDELPSGFDLVLECDVDVYAESLFPKIHDALRPGGRFVIVDQLAPGEDLAPDARVHWAFHASLRRPDFRYLTPAQLQERLTRAGFRILSQRALPTIPGHATRFTRGTFLIEAAR